MSKLRMDQQWIAALQIGFRAYWLRFYSDAGQREKVRQYRDLLEQSLPSNRQDAFRSFPRWILQLLSELPDGFLIDRRLAAEGALRQLLDGGRTWCRTNRSPLAATLIVAHNILSVDGHPEQLLGLIRSLMPPRSGARKIWTGLQRRANLADQLFEPLRVFHNPRATTIDKLTATTNMTEVFRKAGDKLEIDGDGYWSQVRNALYHQLLGWPLLLAIENGVECRMAFSLPVLVTVHFNGTGRVRIEGDKVETLESATSKTDFVMCGGSKRGREEWQRDLELATDAGRELWLDQHGYRGKRRSDSVRNADVVFDFQLARQIVAPVLLELQGESAVAYFAQTVLRQLLGRTGAISSAATGLVARARDLEYDEPTRCLIWRRSGGCRSWPPVILKADEYPMATSLFCRGREQFIIIAAKGGGPKYAHVGASGLFERLISANDSVSEIESSRDQRSPVEVTYVPTLEHMADVAQVSGWRRYLYVRCADVLAGIHTTYPEDRPGLLAHSDPQVQRIHDRLRSNQSTVLRITDSTPRAVASALWHLHERSLSWTFFRITPEESDSAFWETLWPAIGGSAASLDEFRFSPRPSTAAERFAAVLNQFDTTESASGGPPDIVILVGTDRLMTRRRKATQQHDPLVFDDIFTSLEVGQLLKSNPERSVRRLIGRTRLILLPFDESVADADEVPVAHLSGEERETLARLSVFRWGFTQTMAGLALGYERRQGGSRLPKLIGEGVRRKLAKLVEQKVLCYGQGTYHVPDTLRQALCQSSNTEELAHRHLAAGTALAPYVYPSELPTLALDRAFLPEQMHEAAFHFGEAYRLAQPAHTPIPAGANSVRSRASSALEILQRFVLSPQCETVARLISAGHADEAWKLGQRLLGEYARRGTKPPPNAVVTVAQAGRVCLRLGHGMTGTEGSEHWRQLDDMLRQAESTCQMFAHSDGHRLLVLTFWATLLMRDVSGREAEAAALNIEAQQLLSKGVSGASAWPEWFEALGDGIDESAAASESYWAGCTWGPHWFQSWIKWAGSAALAGASGEAIQTRLGNASDGQLLEILAKAAVGLQNDIARAKATGKATVLNRWRAGVQPDLWSTDPTVQSLLQWYRHALGDRPPSI